MALQLPRNDCLLMGCRTREDLEDVSEAQVDEKIIPAITDLDVPLVITIRLRSQSRRYERQRRSHGTESGREQWKTKMFPYHQRS